MANLESFLLRFCVALLKVLILASLSLVASCRGGNSAPTIKSGDGKWESLAASVVGDWIMDEEALVRSWSVFGRRRFSNRSGDVSAEMNEYREVNEAELRKCYQKVRRYYWRFLGEGVCQVLDSHSNGKVVAQAWWRIDDGELSFEPTDGTYCMFVGDALADAGYIEVFAASGVVWIVDGVLVMEHIYRGRYAWRIPLRRMGANG
jgi:hypothetical protein